MCKYYNPNEETTHLMYFDLNNMYGLAMIDPLPYEQCEQVDPYSVNIDNLKECEHIINPTSRFPHKFLITHK